MTKLLIIFTICLLIYALFANPVLSNVVLLQNKLETIAEKCRAIVGATADDVKGLIADELAKTPAGKCLHACVLKELKLVDENGHFQRSMFLEYIKEYSTDAKFIEISMNAFDMCSENKLVVTGEQCDDAEDFRVCMIKAAKKIFDGLLDNEKTHIKGGLFKQ